MSEKLYETIEITDLKDMLNKTKELYGDKPAYKIKQKDENTQPNYKVITHNGIEILIRNLGKEANINKVHPHKFRRTMATMAIDKGMPIEQVQKLLGHIKIDTTTEYAMVNQNNVKNSHRKYIT